jgi:two-component system, cell cycle response regulator
MSERSGDTWIGTPPVAVSCKHTEACLVHIYPTGPDMGRRYPLTPGKIVLGRAEGLDIRVQDNSVSRTHAVVETDTEGCFIIDQKSLNGTHVNDEAVHGAHKLADGDYIRVGNAIFRFLTGGNIEVEYHEEIYRLTIMDGLTQIHNHRYLDEFLERELARAHRHERPLSVLLFDLDKFKSINDRFGHLCGDHVLREVSARVRPTVRREDLFARYGGEEFCMVLVETTHAQAVAAGERIRKLIGCEPFVFEGEPVPVTLSVGVATAGQDQQTVQELMKLADEKLYEAKRTGRNRVVG